MDFQDMFIKAMGDKGVKDLPYRTRKEFAKALALERMGAHKNVTRVWLGAAITEEIIREYRRSVVSV
jgi:hypothetical protein